jgi:hypothetical protein
MHGEQGATSGILFLAAGTGPTDGNNQLRSGDFTMQLSARRLLGTALAAAAASLSLVAAAGTPASASSTAIPHFTSPTVYGTQFQTDPHHDFTKRISPRHDGILRGWVSFYSGGVAEYQPIKWVSGKKAFTGPKEGDAFSYASRVSSTAVLYSVSDCAIHGTHVTADKHGLGTKRCSTAGLVAALKAGHRPAMITIYHGQIVKIQEIRTP